MTQHPNLRVLNSLRPGDLVRLRSEGALRRRRAWVVVSVTAQAIARGTQASAPGLHLVTGYWYPGRPQTLEPYGKLLDLSWHRRLPTYRQDRLVRCGRVHGHYAAKRHCK